MVAADLAPDEYAEEAAFAAGLLASAAVPVTDVLELGSGGGNNALHLKAHFRMTLVDLSEGMLAVSRELNPGCEHSRGDMRTCAWTHLRRGLPPRRDRLHDDREATSPPRSRPPSRTAAPAEPRFSSPTTSARRSSPPRSTAGTTARARPALPDWTWDPDPEDTSIRTEYAFVLRDPSGAVAW